MCALAPHWLALATPSLRRRRRASQEFDTFCADSKLKKAVSKALWSILDRDGSGTVSKDEFHTALLSLQASRRWIRFCPTCEYRNECPYCAECNDTCNRCNEIAFCASCWADHPGRQTSVDDVPEHERIEHNFGSIEHLRENLVIRPLECAPPALRRRHARFGGRAPPPRRRRYVYNHRALRDVPVQYKAGLRQLLYSHKKAAADAAAAAGQVEPDE